MKVMEIITDVRTAVGPYKLEKIETIEVVKPNTFLV